MPKIKPCSINPRHKWEWLKDTTTRQGSFGALGSVLHISRKGVYKCTCGAAKYGEPHSGLERYSDEHKES